MRTFILLLLIPFALLGVVLGLLQWMEYTENPRFQFATYEELKHSEMNGKGWLPSYLPESLTELVGSLDIDTNRVWASFSYRVGDVALAKNACRQIFESESGRKFICPPFDSQTAILILRTDGTGAYQSNWGGL